MKSFCVKFGHNSYAQCRTIKIFLKNKHYIFINISLKACAEITGKEPSKVGVCSSPMWQSCLHTWFSPQTASNELDFENLILNFNMFAILSWLCVICEFSWYSFCGFNQFKKKMLKGTKQNRNSALLVILEGHLLNYYSMTGRKLLICSLKSMKDGALTLSKYDCCIVIIT